MDVSFRQSDSSIGVIVKKDQEIQIAQQQYSFLRSHAASWLCAQSPMTPYGGYSLTFTVIYVRNNL